MENAEWAYGMFASNRDPRVPAAKIGTEAQIVPRRAILVKDKYFVEIASSKEQPDLLRQFVQAMAKGIPGRASCPKHWPGFRRISSLPARCGWCPRACSGSGRSSAAILRSTLTARRSLVRETSPASAAEVMNKLRSRIGGTTPVKIADEGFAATTSISAGFCVFRKGRTIGGLTSLEAGADAVADTAKLADA